MKDLRTGMMRMERMLGQLVAERPRDRELYSQPAPRSSQLGPMDATSNHLLRSSMTATGGSTPPSTLNDWIKGSSQSRPWNTSATRSPAHIFGPSNVRNESAGPSASRSFSRESEDDEIVSVAGDGLPMKDMVYLDEAERLRHELVTLRGARVDFTSTEPAIVSDLEARSVSTMPVLTRRGESLNTFLDPVDLGICTVEEGKRYFKL